MIAVRPFLPRGCSFSFRDRLARGLDVGVIRLHGVISTNFRLE